MLLHDSQARSILLAKDLFSDVDKKIDHIKNPSRLYCFL
jgi:hypothetical protein